MIVSPRRPHKRRVSDRKRHAAAFFVSAVLADQSELAPEIPIVGVEHHKRIVELPLLLELVDNRSDRSIHRQQRSKLLEPKPVDSRVYLFVGELRFALKPARLVGHRLRVEVWRSPRRP